MLIRAKEIMKTASYGDLQPGEEKEVTTIDGKGYIKAGLAEEVKKKKEVK